MITAVIGAQYGSEGKGKVVEHLAPEYDVFVRVGGPNAGHVIYHESKKYTMRSVPCGWINKNAKLVIGAGAVVSPHVLMNEIDWIREIDPEIDNRLYIDPRATMITEDDVRSEQGLAVSIGSTGEGVGAARKRRIDRDTKLLGEFKDLAPYFADTVNLLHQWQGLNILLEGTQGTHLSMIHGDYPFTTSHDTSVAQMCADAGIPAQKIDKVYAAIRTFPIRVGGKSGPLHRESSFEDLAERTNYTVEHTSVTKKVRRIGWLDWEQLYKTKQLNAPTHLAVMFTDYYNIDSIGETDFKKLPADVKRLVQNLEMLFDAPAEFISTGINTMIRKKGQKWVLK